MKQAIRNTMIEKQAQNLMQIKSRDEEILNKQVADAEEKAFKIFEEKERKA